MKSICFLFVLFLLFPGRTFSQLKIAKEVLGCTYGLKNQQGEWVVEPVYILVEDLRNGCFSCLDTAGL